MNAHTTSKNAYSLVGIAADLTIAGVRLNGPNPWDPQIHDARVMERIFNEGYIGLGEAYVDGWWTCEDLAMLTYKIASSGVMERLDALQKAVPRREMSERDGHNLTAEKQAISFHYDGKGIDWFQAMLGLSMQYSCSRDFESHGDLSVAQQAKMMNLGEKLGLHDGANVVEVGSGFGTLARMLNNRFGYCVRGMTLSGLQLDYAQRHCTNEHVSFHDQNYQATPNKLFPAENFDGLISVGMIEHVGKANLGIYFDTCAKLLKSDGVAVIHGICSAPGGSNTWIEKHIFPGGYIPAFVELEVAIDAAGFTVRDIENIGLNYDPTLLAWRSNLMSAKRRLLATGKYSERDFRTEDFYLSTCAGMFRAEKLSVRQMVLTKRGSRRPYQRVA